MKAPSPSFHRHSDAIVRDVDVGDSRDRPTNQRLGQESEEGDYGSRSLILIAKIRSSESLAMRRIPSTSSLVIAFE